MTTITQLREIIDTVRDLPNKKEKLEYLNTLDRDILNFLAGNIKKDGIAKAIASEIPITTMDIIDSTTMEGIVNQFNAASNLSRKKDKIRQMKYIIVSPEDRDLVLVILYGSLKLGLKIPIPEPEFGETIKPQLCGTGIKFDPKKYIIEEKFDGIRCIATKNNSVITLQSRNGKILNIPNISNYLIHCIPNGCIIDGEIIASDGQFESLNRKSDNLIYMIFDIIFNVNYDIIDHKSEKINDPLYIRLMQLKDIINETDHIKISQPLDLNSIEEIDNWIVKTGAEGIVAKNPNSTYTYGDRKDWIKYKHFQDCTCTVINYTEGTGKREGIMGAINVIPDGHDQITKVGSGFTDNQLIEMKQLIDNGEKVMVDVKFQNWTSDGCLRFPIFLRIRTINDNEI